MDFEDTLLCSRSACMNPAEVVLVVGGLPTLCRKCLDELYASSQTPPPYKNLYEAIEAIAPRKETP